MSVAAVVVAAGQGQRYGGPKQFAVLNHDTVTAHSVRAARSVAERVVLVVPVELSGQRRRRRRRGGRWSDARGLGTRRAGGMR